MSTSTVKLGLMPKIIFVAVAIVATSAALFVYMYKNGNATPNSHANEFVEPPDIPATKATIIEISDVFNAVNPSDEWFQLYNKSKSAIPLKGWSVCTSNTCVTIPDTTIPAGQLAKFRANQFQNWPTNGLNGDNDMLGIKNASGAPVDSLNWGNPSVNWRNYSTFVSMLWAPGLQVDASMDQTFYRDINNPDTNKLSDWRTYESVPANSSAQKGSTTIEILDVFNAVNPSDEWFKIYNMTQKDLTLTAWSICSRNNCYKLPTTTIERFNFVKFNASSISGWTALNGKNDMLALKDDSGKIIDSLNWGTPATVWNNYQGFKNVLWNPGITPPDPNNDQDFFRQAIGKDTDQATDWLTTAGAKKTTSTGTTTAINTKLPLQVLQVNKTVDPKNTLIIIYNNSDQAVPLAGYELCNKKGCASLVTFQSIDAFSEEPFQYCMLQPVGFNDLDLNNDMVGIFKQSVDDGILQPSDVLNWGTPDGSKYYSYFRSMLWNPGLKADAKMDQKFYRQNTGLDTDQATDWLTTNSNPTKSVTTCKTSPVPGSSGNTAGTGGTSNDQTVSANYDLNGNGSVGVEDSILFMTCYQNIYVKLQSVAQNKQCDFNGDGKIDMNDFVNLLGAMSQKSYGNKQ